MRAPVRSAEEEHQLATLRALGLPDTAPEERYDAITKTAAALFHAPISLISLVDTDRQWFKSRRGLTASETPRDVSLRNSAGQNAAAVVLRQF